MVTNYPHTNFYQPDRLTDEQKEKIALHDALEFYNSSDKKLDTIIQIARNLRAHPSIRDRKRTELTSIIYGFLTTIKRTDISTKVLKQSQKISIH